MITISYGYITARIYTSEAEIPIKDATFIVTGQSDENTILYGIRKTDENGKTTLISVDTPDIEISLTPGNQKPFKSVNVIIEHPDFITKYITGVQIFPQQVSVQEASMLPNIKNKAESKIEKYDIDSQDL